MEAAEVREEEQEGETKTAEQQVIQFLREHGESTRADIMANANGFSPKSASNALYDLINKGVIRRVNADERGYGSNARYALVEPDSNDQEERDEDT